MNPSWTFCGPPFLNGNLHIGHGVNFIVKDFALRYQKSILKESANWKYIFDCHGLPIEREAEKVLVPGEQMIDKCLELNNFYYRKSLDILDKLKLLHPVKQNSFFTNQINYKVSLMNFLSELYDSGKLYRKLKHTPYCFICDSSLANAEIEKKQIKERVHLIPVQIISGTYAGCKLIFATTQFETVYQNKAIALNPEHKYGLKEGVISGIPSQSLIKGIELKNSKYKLVLEDRQLINTIVCSSKIHTNNLEEDTILSRYASVGLSPWGGEIDLDIILENQLMTQAEIELECEKRKLQRIQVIKNNSRIPVLEKIPREPSVQEVCWRCNNKIGMALTEQWYIHIDSQNRKILSSVAEVGTNDPYIHAQTIKFFKQPVDWNISRSREYGTPLPLLQCTCGQTRTVYYKQEDFSDISQCFPSRIENVLLRKGVNLSCSCGSTFKPCKYSVDVWVDSGFLPSYFKQDPYPTLIEGLDQKRGFFYATGVISVLKNNRLPYKNLYYLGWIVNNSRKISKSNNTTGTLEDLLAKTNILNLRSFALTNSNSINTEYSIDLVNQQKKYINTILNVKKFLNLEQFSNIPSKQSEKFKEELIELDQLISSLQDYFKFNRYDKYWNTLKDHILKVYSRKYINDYKKQDDMETRVFLKYYGEKLLEYIYPVLGEL